MRARLAYAEMAVPREQLAVPSARRRTRIELWQELRKLGTIDEATIRFVRDPQDGQLFELGVKPDDRTAVLRISAMVTPRD